MAKQRRRGPGEGSIRERDDGRWEGRLRLVDGRQRSFYADTYDEAAKKLRAALRARDAGLPIPGENVRVAEYLDWWLSTVAKRRVRPSTLTSYELHVRVHLVPAIGKVRLARLGPQHVEAFIARQLESDLSPTTIARQHATLRAALNTALKYGLVSRNAAALVTAPRASRKEIQPLTPDEARTFLEAAARHRLEALYLTAIATGMRQGELLALRWTDLDADGTLHVRYAMQRVDGEPQFVEPKTEKSRRSLVMPAVVLDALKAHRARQATERLAAGEHWQDWGLVFPSTAGTPLDSRNVTKTLQKILASAGLPRQRFQDLRHAAASFYLAQGLDLREVMEILGHSQIALTANTYTHILPKLKRDAADRMDALLTSREG